MANKIIAESLKYGGPIPWTLPTFSSTSQDGYTLAIAGVSEYAGGYLTPSNYYYILGRQYTNTFDGRTGWSITITCPYQVQLTGGILYTGWYGGNSANYVSSFGITLGGTSVGSFTPTQSQNTTNPFTITSTTKSNTIVATFYGSYYAAVCGLVLNGKR